MTTNLMHLVDDGAYQELFIEELNWQAPDKTPVTLTTEDGTSLTARNVASHEGIRVWVCDQQPGSSLEAQLDRFIAKTTTDRLVIFRSAKEQVWRWPVRRTRDGSVSDRLTSHRHRTGDPDPKFLAKLETIRLPFDTSLDATTVLRKVRDAFDVEVKNESKRASQLMARMYTALDAAYPADMHPQQRTHEISVTLARLLFLLFGDDTRMWDTDAFRNLIQHHTKRDGTDFATVLTNLFTQLDSPTAANGPYDGFKYVNGGIFADRIDLPALNSNFRDAVLDACAVDWSDISPAIFGSMFQAVRDAKTRRDLGEHYTSEENILKTLNPLFLDELRDQLERALALDTPRKQRNALTKLHDHLGDLRFMDPACGCGNFIVVAYRELRAIELSVLEALRDVDIELDPTLEGTAMLLANVGLKVTLDHFHGIEIDEWPARIAETAMFLVDRQCDLKLDERLGWAPDRLPIERQANIVVGNAVRLDWTVICPPSDDVLIAGNPPFLGPHSRTKDQLTDLQIVWGTKDLGRLDYVTAWHRKCIDYYATVPGGRFALVSTNSIAQGDQVARLFPTIFDAGWRLRFAHQTFGWTSEASGAAAVHCVITGFDKHETSPAQLFQYAHSRSTPVRSVVKNINAYLVDGPDLIVTSRSTPLAPDLHQIVLGSMAKDGGHLIVEPDEYPLFAADPIAARYVRPYLGSRELLHNEKRWCIWLNGADEKDWSQSPLLRQRVQAAHAYRSTAKAPSTRDFASIPHLFTQRAEQATSFVCIPGLSSELRPYLPCARVSSSVIASHANYQVSDPDGFQFAILSSSMLLTWQKTVGGRLKSDIRFAVRTVWNNFPLPALTDDQRAAIIAAGQAVLNARALHPERSLAQHYPAGPLDPVLATAHRRLDTLVNSTFGLAPDASDGERQQALFNAYTRW